jgi:hypothetical protein
MGEHAGGMRGIGISPDQGRLLSISFNEDEWELDGMLCNYIPVNCSPSALLSR